MNIWENMRLLQYVLGLVYIFFFEDVFQVVDRFKGTTPRGKNRIISKMSTENKKILYHKQADFISDVEEYDICMIPVIVCDIDEVILQFIPEIENIIGRRLTKFEKTKEVMDAVHEIHESDILSRLKPYPGSRKYFNRLTKQFQMVLLTATPEEHNHKRIVNLRGYNYSSIVNAHSSVKYKKVMEIDPLFVIEDRPDTIKSISDVGYFVFYPTWVEYNENLQINGTHGFSSWGELYNEIINIFS